MKTNNMNGLLRYFLVSILFLVSVIAYSQNGTIRGTVIDDATGETLFGVTVVIFRFGKIFHSIRQDLLQRLAAFHLLEGRFMSLTKFL